MGSTLSTIFFDGLHVSVYANDILIYSFLRRLAFSLDWTFYLTSSSTDLLITLYQLSQHISAIMADAEPQVKPEDHVMQPEEEGNDEVRAHHTTSTTKDRRRQTTKILLVTNRKRYQP